MAEEKEPKKLYKYRSWPCKYTKDILINNRLYLSSPKEFNDPFDCEFYLDMSGTEDELLSAIKRDIKKENMTSTQIDKIRKKISTPKGRKDLGEGLGNDMVRTVKNKFGICCFSACKNNILMWSHYAASHRGICLEFKNIPQNWIIKPIHYAGYPSVEYKNPDDDERVMPIFFIKYSKWEDEQEYRIVFSNKAKQYLPFKPQMLTGVICGCEMSNEYQSDLVKILEGRNTPIALYKARKKERKFGLDTDEVIGVYGGGK